MSRARELWALLLPLASCDTSAFDQERLEGLFEFSEDSTLTANELTLVSAHWDLQGSIQVRVIARTLTLEGPALIEGDGSAGLEGNPGQDGSLGIYPDCQPLPPERDGDGYPAWCTSNWRDWRAASEECLRAPHCGRGKNGSTGGEGGDGPQVLFLLQEVPTLGGLTVALRGGVRGEGGRGGLGYQLYWAPRCFADSTVLRATDYPDRVTKCPDGSKGIDGLIGRDGHCWVQILDQPPRPCLDFP